MKNKKSLGGILLLALTVGVVGSLAYFSQELTKQMNLKQQNMILQLKKNLLHQLIGYQELK